MPATGGGETFASWMGEEAAHHHTAVTVVKGIVEVVGALIDITTGF
jgi:hypothetical protein